MVKDNEILTQMKAIRAKCLDCCCYSAPEVELCPSTACTLYPYRFGRSPRGFKKTIRTAPFLERIEKGKDGIVITRQIVYKGRGSASDKK